MTSTVKANLKPCPFCGGHATLIYDNQEGYRIYWKTLELIKRLKATLYNHTDYGKNMAIRKEILMNNKYRIEVDTGNGGYGFTDTLAELLADVELEYGKKEVEKVSIWTKSSKEGDEYISEDKRMHIWNIGKSKWNDDLLWRLEAMIWSHILY